LAASLWGLVLRTVLRRGFTPGLKANLLSTAALGLAIAGAAQAQTPSPSNLPRFQSTWQEVTKANAGFFSSGVAQEFAYTAGPGGVTAVAPPSTNLIANVRQIYGAQGQMTYFEILDGIRNVSFVRASTDTFIPIATDRALYLRASDWTRQAIVADPLALGWQYQSFAAWQTGLGQPNGSMGATSFGNETAWNGTTAVPQAGEATFNGFMGAIYNDAVGQDRAVTADVGIQMNFGAHTASFATTNTRDRNGVALDELNITGSFVGLPNFPQMFGSLETGHLKGTSSGRFFGPAAEEFGGVFTLTPKSGEGLERLAGAFGSRQGAPAQTSRFTTWSEALKPNATVFATGLANGFGGNNNYFSQNNATYTLGLNAATAITSLRVAVLTGGPNYAAQPGQSIGALASDRRFILAGTTDRTDTVLVADPVQMGWDYQSFGAWALLSNNGGFSVYAGGFSAGAATPGDAIPPTGEVTFRGVAVATYEQSRDQRSYVSADVTLDTNFAARTANFRTSDMKSVTDGTVIGRTALSATLTWNPGANALSGSASTADNRMTGGINAQFYGPQAQEVGGAFAVKANEYERLSGAFGAKR
jgi:hypothetical protein